MVQVVLVGSWAVFTPDPSLGPADTLTASRPFCLFPVDMALGRELPLAHRRGVGSLQGPLLLSREEGCVTQAWSVVSSSYTSSCLFRRRLVSTQKPAPGLKGGPSRLGWAAVPMVLC